MIWVYELPRVSTRGPIKEVPAYAKQMACEPHAMK